MTTSRSPLYDFVHHPYDALALYDAEDLRLLASNEAFSLWLNSDGNESLDALLIDRFGGKLPVWKAGRSESILTENPAEPAELQAITKSSKKYWRLRISPARSIDFGQYKNLYDQNVAGVVSVNAKGIVSNCNQAFARMLGYDDHRHLRGKAIADHYAPNYDRETYLKRLRKEGMVSNFAIELRKMDGSPVWCLENSYLTQEEEGDTIQATLVDITSSFTNQRKYEMLFQQAMDAMVMVEGGQVSNANKQALTIFASSLDRLKKRNLIGGKKGIVVESETDTELLLLKIEQAHEGQEHRAACVCRRDDGTKFHAELKLSPFNFEAENQLCITIRDVTERVLFENAIRESEERFRMLSDVAMESVLFVHQDIILDCNEQSTRLLEYAKRDDLIGKNLSDFLNEEDIEHMRRVLDVGTHRHTEVRANTRSGESLFLEVSGSYIFYQGEEIEVFLFYDITSRKRAEKQLEQSIDRFKNLVENSPNGVFIVTENHIKYANQSGIQLLGADDEDDVFDLDILGFFDEKAAEQVAQDLMHIREGEEVDYRETTIKNLEGKDVDVGIKGTLTVYDNQPSIQLTLNNLTTRMMLLQEKVRAKLAEEINEVLKREIEEHKITQDKLQTAQNFTRNIIESSIDMIIAVDGDNKITEFNTAAQMQFGFRLDDMLGKDVGVLYQHKSQYKEVGEALETLGSFSGEIENVDRDGKVFTCLLSASLIRNPEGEILGSMGVSRDITDLKQAQQELRESEERYRDIFDNARDFILSIDTDGMLIYANNAVVNALGYGRPDLGEKSIFDLLQPGSVDKRKKLFDSFVDDHLEVKFLARDGSQIIAEGNSSIRYKDKKPHSIRAILRDVTEARLNEQRALEQQARLESIFESTRNMSMWTLDLNFKITSCNRNFAKYMRHQFGEDVKVGTPFLEQMKKHVSDTLYAGELRAFGKAFDGQAQQFEVALHNLHGEHVWLQVFLNPVYAGDVFEEISCLAYDITDRKSIDSRIRDSLKEKEVLLKEVHHRVKNNLQVISSILSLQSSFVQDDSTLEILQESQNRIKSMSYIHETLYRTTDFSSIEFTDYIRNIARNLVHTYSFTSGEVELRTEFDEIFLSLDQAIPSGLIINELVSNALKYAFEGVENPTLTIRIKEEKGKIILLIADNGIGLPENFRYEEADSLGVQLVYTLVEQLDGTIEVQTEAGTRFLITFDKA